MYCTNEIKFKLIKSNKQIDFSLTVKAATLKFISGRGSAISSAKEKESGFYLVKLFGPRKRAYIS